jgi:hypothetical protein
MTSPIKYSFELLTDFCNKNSVTLVNDYSNEKLFGSTKLNFYCTECNKENIKCFTYLIKRNTLCKRCITLKSLPKQKETMLKKYGVEHASQNKQIRDKIKENFIKKIWRRQSIKIRRNKTETNKYKFKKLWC